MFSMTKKIALAASLLALYSGQSVSFASISQSSQDRQDQGNQCRLPLQIDNTESIEFENAMTHLPVGVQEDWIELKVIKDKSNRANKNAPHNFDQIPDYSINILPKDVMRRIFLLVNKEHNLGVLAKVCKRWHKHIYDTEGINQKMTYEAAPIFAKDYMDARWDEIFRNAKLFHYDSDRNSYEVFYDCARRRSECYNHGKYSRYYFFICMADFLRVPKAIRVGYYDITVLIITRKEALKSTADPSHPLHSVVYESKKRNAPILIFFRQLRYRNLNNFEYVSHLPIKELSEKDLCKLYSKSRCNLRCADGYVPLKDFMCTRLHTGVTSDGEGNITGEVTWFESYPIIPDLKNVIFSCGFNELTRARQNSCNLM